LGFPAKKINYEEQKMEKSEKKVADGRDCGHKEQSIVVNMEGRTDRGLMSEECKETSGQNRAKKVDPGYADL
jgi:hypothetical protein